MEHGYKIESTYIGNRPIYITVSNYPNINQVVEFVWISKIPDWGLTKHTVAVFKIKWKEQ